MKLPFILQDTKTHNCLTLHPVGEEASFSNSSCHCCDSGLGGDRHDCHLFGHNKQTDKWEVVDDQVRVCTDCLFEHCEV